MKIISVNVGLPRELISKGKLVTTGIFKNPVEGRTVLRSLNLEGDRQADLSVHGGPDKAVYAYPCEHYDYWRRELPDMDLPFGMFGENLTTNGLDETVNIGDRFRAGSALLMVTQPRLPCYKLSIKFGRDDIIKRFLNSGRTGFYFSVVEEGDVAADDPILLIESDGTGMTVADITGLYISKNPDPELLRQASVLEALPASWRDYFHNRALELM